MEGMVKGSFVAVAKMELKFRVESTSAPARMILKLASAALRRKKL